MFVCELTTSGTCLLIYRWRDPSATQNGSLTLRKRMLTSWLWGETAVQSQPRWCLFTNEHPQDMTARSVFRVDLYNASNLKFGDEFLGGVRVPLRVLSQAGVHDAWWETHCEWFGRFGTSVFFPLLLPDPVRLWLIRYLLLWNLWMTQQSALINGGSLRKLWNRIEMYVFFLLACIPNLYMFQWALRKLIDCS